MLLFDLNQCSDVLNNGFGALVTLLSFLPHYPKEFLGNRGLRGVLSPTVLFLTSA